VRATTPVNTTILRVDHAVPLLLPIDGTDRQTDELAHNTTTLRVDHAVPRGAAAADRRDRQMDGRTGPQYDDIARRSRGAPSERGISHVERATRRAPADRLQRSGLPGSWDASSTSLDVQEDDSYSGRGRMGRRRTMEQKFNTD